MRETRKRRDPSGRQPGRVRESADERAMYTVGPEDNIFAALGRPNADELLAKAEMARVLRRLVEERALTQTEAARLLGVSQPEVSDLVRGRLSGFSLERLSRLLTLFGQDIRIVVQPKPASRKTATLQTVVRTTRVAV
jgi:predicted XRE-type DNA-binding protein